jgi:hypothetical protein
MNLWNAAVSKKIVLDANLPSRTEKTSAVSQTDVLPFGDRNV